MSRQKFLILVLAFTVFFTYLSIASFLALFNIVLPLGTVDFVYIEAGILINIAVVAVLISRNRDDSNKTTTRL